MFGIHSRKQNSRTQANHSGIQAGPGVRSLPRLNHLTFQGDVPTAHCTSAHIKSAPQPPEALWRRGTKAFCKNGIKFFSSERFKLTQTQNDTSMPITRHQSVSRNNIIISHVHLLHASTSPHNPSSSPLRDEHHPAVPAGLKLAVNWGNCNEIVIKTVLNVLIVYLQFAKTLPIWPKISGHLYPSIIWTSCLILVSFHFFPAIQASFLETSKNRRRSTSFDQSEPVRSRLPCIWSISLHSMRALRHQGPAIDSTHQLGFREDVV